MLRRTMQIPIWPRCCGFRFYFWEGHREKQLFLEPWAAGLWLQFFLLPWAGCGLGHPCWGESTVPATTLLTACPAVSAAPLNLSPLLQVSPALVGAGWDPGLRDFPAKLCLSPDLTQRLGSSAALPLLSTQGKAVRGQTLPPLSQGYSAWNKIRIGFWRLKMSLQCVCSVGVPGGAQGWAWPSQGSVLTYLDCHIFPSAHLTLANLKAKRG